MIETLALVCALSTGYCNKPAAVAFARDVDAEVEDVRMRALLVVMAHHESELSEHPRPQSHDALDGTSCGILQMRCGFVRTHTVQQQIHEWLRNVQQTSLACVMGSCKAIRLMNSRLAEAARLLALVGVNATP